MIRTPSIPAPIADGVVHPIRTEFDAAAFTEWLGWPHEFLAYDCETTGLSFTDDVRLVQVGDTREAWVFDPHEFPGLIENAFYFDHPLVAHNAPFDALHVARLQYGPDLRLVAEEARSLLKVTTDTVVLAHLVDPRDKTDNGMGHGLKDLAAHYVDDTAPDSAKAIKALFREQGLTMANGFAQVDKWHPTFVVYGGMDVLLTARLYVALRDKVAALGLGHLADFEHEVQQGTTARTARGFAIDLDYALRTEGELRDEVWAATRQTLMMGVENLNSTSQVAEALLTRGCTLTARTPSGAWKVDRHVLGALDDDLARAVMAAKASNKMLANWIEPLIASASIDGRAHSRFKTLAAITARMASTQPNLMNLPAGDHRVRSCLVADPGKTLISADFSQIEFRVLGALADCPSLQAVFNAGDDLPPATAPMLFGADHTPAQRRLAKGGGFGQIFGGGVATLSRQAGVSKAEAKVAMDRFTRSFPKVKRWTNQLSERTRYGDPVVVTPTGRRIPVERDRSYRSVNYCIQSAAADIFKGALVNLEKAGLGDLLIPLHDEVIAQADNDSVDDVAAEFAKVMSGDLGPVPIVAVAEVVGHSWGDKYARPHDG